MWCYSLVDLCALDEWNQLSLADKVASFRVLAQGCTPDSQTVPRAELAAVVWAPNWAAQNPRSEAFLFTDSQFVIDLWQHKHLQPGTFANLANDDLAAQLPVSERLHLNKVKAHNQQGLAADASPYLRWTTMGNEVADAAAKQARRTELNTVF